MQKHPKYQNPLLVRTIIQDLFIAGFVGFFALQISSHINLSARFFFWPDQLESFLLIVFCISTVLLLSSHRKQMNQGSSETFSSLTFLVLLLILSGGAFLRFWQLDYLQPAGDEYRHLNAAKHFFTEGYFEYPRSPLITQILIFIRETFKTTSLYLQRLPFAIMGILSILLTYALGRTRSEITGLIAAYLLAFAPLAIGLSRYIREYELIYLLSLVFLFLSQLEFLKPSFVRLPLLMLIMKYIPEIGISDGFDAAFFFFLIFGGIHLLIDIFNQLSLAPKRDLIYRFTFLALIFIVGILLIPHLTRFSPLTRPTINYLFLVNYNYSTTLWYFNFTPYLLIFFLLLLPIIMKPRDSFVTALSFTLVFGLVFYLYFFDNPRRFQDRYAYYLIPYLILLVAIGIDCFQQLLRETHLRLILVGFVFVFAFNPYKAFVYTLNEENGQNDPKTNLAHFDAGKLVQTIQRLQIDLDKTLITTPWIVDYYFDQPYLHTQAEKERYVHFPWQYELFDRTRVFSINGYWAEDHLNKIKEILNRENIEYLIFHGTSDNSKVYGNYSFAPRHLRGITPIALIDADKNLRFYIYKVKPYSANTSLQLK